MATYNLTGFPISSSSKSIRVRFPRFEVPTISDNVINSLSVTMPFRLASGYSTGSYSVTLVLCTGISNSDWYEYDSGGYSYYGTDTGDSTDRIYTGYYSHVIPSSKVLATTSGTISFSATQTNTPTTFTFSNLNLSPSAIGSEIGVAVLYSNSGAIEYSAGQSCSGTITTTTRYTITYPSVDSNWTNAPVSPQYKNAGQSIRIADFPIWVGTSPTSSRTVTCNFNGNGQSSVSYTVKRWDDGTWQGFYSWVDSTGKEWFPDEYYSTDADLSITSCTGWWGTNHSDGFTLPTPTRSGYTFQGWYSASSGGTKVGDGGDTYTSTTYSTIYAQWKANTYTVTYSNNGGWTVPSAQTVNVGTNLVISSTVPTKANDNYVNYTTTLVYNNGNSNGSQSTQSYTQYTFDHWYNGESTWNPGDTYYGQTDITLYIYYYYGSRYTGFQLPVPTRTGYTFDYWGDSSGNKLETSTGTDGAAGSWYYPRSTHSIYAYWKANTYTVSYNANGGAGAPSAQTKTYDITLTLSSTKPTKSNSISTITTTLKTDAAETYAVVTTDKTISYVFKDWNTNSNGSGISYSSGDSYTANSGVTLYAQYTEATNYESFSYSKPTKVNMEFVGWYTSADGGSLVWNGEGTYMPTTNQTLYAHWKIKGWNDLNIFYYNELLSKIPINNIKYYDGSSWINISNVKYYVGI